MLCLVEDEVIGNSRMQFGNVLNVVSMAPQPFDNRAIDAFVGNNVHVTFSPMPYTTSLRKAREAKAIAARIASRVKRG